MGRVIAHQAQIRQTLSETEAEEGLFGAYWEELNTDIQNGVLQEITHTAARRFIEKYEWLGTFCNAPLASFGITFDGYLGGVIVFGSVSPPSVAVSLVGQELAHTVVQLGRGACAHWAHEHTASRLIGYGLQEMGKRGYRVAIAYADPAAGEIGTVYQATNWLFCGWTEKRPDYFDSRTGKRITGPVGKVKSWMERKPKLRKRRYVQVLGNKTERKQVRKRLQWPIRPYDKRIGNWRQPPD